MTNKEIANLLALALANFPHMQNMDMRPTAVLWEKMLHDIPYTVAEKALLKVLATCKYFPNVAEIREAAAALTMPRHPTASEAWAAVQEAIWKYSSYREKEALESLPPVVAKVVKEIGWREICLSENPDVIRGQFRRAYETEVTRYNEMAALPADIRGLIEGTAAALSPANNVSGYLV